MVRWSAAHRQLVLDVAIVGSSLWVLANNYAIFAWWAVSLSCPPGVFCTFMTFPTLPNPATLVASYMLFFGAAALSGAFVYDEGRREGPILGRRSAWHPVTAGLLFSAAAWSASLLILAAVGFGSAYPMMGGYGLAGAPFYIALLAIPCVTLVLGVASGVDATRRTRGQRRHFRS